MVAEIGFVYFPATPTNFSVFVKEDPAPNVRKTLVIKYSYSGEPRGDEHTLTALDGEEVRIPSSPALAEVDNRNPQSTTAAAKPAAGDTTAANTPRVAAATNILYAKYKCKYAYIDGKYIRLPDFNLRYENSRGSTRLPEREKYTTTYHTEHVTRRSGGNIKRSPGPRKRNEIPIYDAPYETVDVEIPTSIRLPAQDIAELDRIWHTELPAIRVGEFGFWPPNERLSVTFVLGPDDVLLSCNEVSFRLKGVDTRGMKEGNEVTTLRTYVQGRVTVVEKDAESSARISGTHGNAESSVRSSATTKTYDTMSVERYGATFSIAIIAERPVEGFGDTPTLLALPTEIVRKGLSLEQFVEMVNSGIDPEKEDRNAKSNLVIRRTDENPDVTDTNPKQ